MGTQDDELALALAPGADETYSMIIEERPVTDDAPGLKQLLTLGLVAQNPVRPGYYIALDAQLAIGHLMAAEQAALHRTARRMADIASLDRLAAKHAEARLWGGPGSELLPTPELVSARIDESVSRATTEVLTAQPGPRKRATIQSVMERDTGLLLRGVQMRIIYHASTRANPAVKDYTEEMLASGAEIRVLHGPFPQIIIIDGREAFIRNLASKDPEDMSGWHVRDLATVTYMRESYLIGWMRAEAWEGPTTQKGWQTRRQQEILQLLAAGFELGQIGKRLSVSDRTVSSDLAAMRSALGLDTTFQLMVWYGKQPRKN
ncbi:LuxR C-terminal-related transcriptional regulator [Streptomyces sp. NPDC059534]|uniref:helix-turn-helix transcriptional regulator n=1 Tax=Streptomyces sp. NPDC059534 TaxID=3346859 RepID=UPI0036AADC6D